VGAHENGFQTDKLPEPLKLQQKATCLNEESLMKYRKITAVIRRNTLKRLVKNLKEIGVRGMTVSRVEGFGEHAELYAGDRLVPGAKIEIYVTENMVEEISRVIVAIAHTGRSGDGILAIHPVEELCQIQAQEVPGFD